MGSGEVAIVALSTMISLKVTFSDGLGGLSPALVCSRWRAMVSASSLGAPGICVQLKYYTFPAFEAILFRKLRLFCSGICGYACVLADVF